MIALKEQVVIMNVKNMVMNFLQHKIVDLCIQSYKQGKDDFEKGCYDEADFKRAFVGEIKKKLRS